MPVQGAQKSGTAHTVSFAEELGREIIGVTWGGHETVPQNEIVELLRSHGHPGYDLSTERDALLQFFRRYENVPTGGPTGGKLQALTRQFHRLLAQYEVSESDLEDLIRTLREMYWESRHSRASQAGGL